MVASAKDVLDYAAGLRTGDHAVFFYESNETAAQLFASYIRGGLPQNSAAYFVGPNRDEYEGLLRLGGINVEQLEGTGQLTYLSYPECYLRDGRYSWEQVNAALNTMLERSRRGGFKETRSMFLTHYLLQYTSRKELGNHEARLGLSLSHPMSAVCGYDAKVTIDSGGDDLFVSLLASHGHHIFKGLAGPRL